MEDDEIMAGLHVTSRCSNRAQTFFQIVWLSPDIWSRAQFAVRRLEFPKYFAYSPQAKRFGFTKQRLTRCGSPIADWTSAPLHKQRYFRRPASSSSLSCLFIWTRGPTGDVLRKRSTHRRTRPVPRRRWWWRGAARSPGWRQRGAHIVQTAWRVRWFSRKTARETWKIDGRGAEQAVWRSRPLFSFSQHKDGTVDEPLNIWIMLDKEGEGGVGNW